MPTRGEARGERRMTLEAAFRHGLALQGGGDPAAAVSIWRQILAHRPDHAGAMHYLGLALVATGDAAAGFDLLGRAAAAPEATAASHANFGLALLEAGRGAEAVEPFRRALAADPGNRTAHERLGPLLLGLGRTVEAADALRCAVAAVPDFRPSRRPLAVALDRLGRPDEAAAVLDDALARWPDDPDLGYLRGVLLLAAGDLAAAEARFRDLVARHPERAAGHKGLGSVLRRQDRLVEAEAALTRAVAHGPADGETCVEFGLVLQGLGRLDAAIGWYERALAAQPGDALAGYSRARCLLLAGRLAEGYAEYERWRWRQYDRPDPRWSKRKAYPWPQPRWDGADPAGRRLLVWAEQGVGDEIMFAAMVPRLLDRGAAVTMTCDARMAPVFRRSFPGVEVIARSDPPDPRLLRPDIDFQVPMMTLCRWHAPGVDPVPPRSPYLVPDAARRARCRGRYEALGPGPKIGISWRSANVDMGARKTAALALWEPVLRTAGMRFVNLQYGDCRADLALARARFGVEIFHDDAVDPLVSMDDFMAQVAALDLVISIDNTTVHAAGALAVPCWVLLPHAPDWRWTAGRDDSLWYPTLTLFRSPAPGGWSTMLASVAAALVAWRDRR